MIINIRGTSGSGKTHLARLIMEQYGAKARVKEEGRKQPLAYILQPKEGSKAKPLVVVGHYETACGGCDTIPTMDKIFEIVRKADNDGFDVLFEGLLISADAKRTIDLGHGNPNFLVVALNTPLDECIASINKRRWAKDPSKPPVATKNTESKFRGVQLCMKRFAENDVRAEWHDRESGFKRICEALNV